MATDDLNIPSKTSKLTHVEVEREVEYYYCNESELNALKSTGFIQNITLSVGVGGVFFGVPLLLGIASIQLGDAANREASVMVGIISMLVSAVLIWVTYLLNEQGKGLLANLKAGRGHTKRPA